MVKIIADFTPFVNLTKNLIIDLCNISIELY